MIYLTIYLVGMVCNILLLVFDDLVYGPTAYVDRFIVIIVWPVCIPLLLIFNMFKNLEKYLNNKWDD